LLLAKPSTNLKLGLNTGNDEVNWKQSHHNTEASKYRDTKHHVQEDEGNNDLQRAGPEHPKVRRYVSKSLRID